MLKKKILDDIEKKNIIVGIIGLGYVGLPLAVTYADKGFKVLGFDKDKSKIKKIHNGENYIGDIDDEVFRKHTIDKRLTATDDFSEISECKAIIICVPTPLDKFKKPNMEYIRESCETIGDNLTKGTFICLESTTYPTTTENYMLPILQERSGLQPESDFWLAFSPERVDPGNKQFKTGNTPKILGAMSNDGKEIGLALYQSAIETIHAVSSPRVAEMVKILENTYRLINISMINELALLANRMKIDIWEVIDAAKTKPYGFQAFYPGPGIGGHCIPLDPFYLEHIAKKYNFDLTMIHTAGQIDNLMPHRMMVKINFALNKQKKPLNGSNILFLGAAYKADIGDERESPTLKIIDEVVRKGGIVSYNDPYIDSITTEAGHEFDNRDLTEDLLKKADCVVITTKHGIYDFDYIKEKASLIVDLRDAYSTNEGNNIYKL